MSKTNHFGRPKGYAVCFRKECPLAQSCLRQLSADDPSEERFISVVNLSLVRGAAKQCPFYKSSEKVRVAYGIDHIFNDIPFSKHKQVFHSVKNYFGKSTYYRIANKRRPIWPNEQEYVRQVFARNGISEPVEFGEYQDIYNW